MAQKYLEIYLDSAETQYDTGLLPVLSLAKQNGAVSFVPIKGSQTRVGNAGDPQYAIQRMKRIKGGEAPAQTGKAGDDLVAMYNQAQRVSWETVEVKTGKKKMILIESEDFDSADIAEDATPLKRTIDNSTTNTLFATEEVATEHLFAGASNAASAPVLTTTSTPEEIEAAISPLIEQIQLLVDDFKSYTSTPAVVIHPTLAKGFAKLQGQGYAQGTNTFPNGFKNGFTYDGIEFFISPILNAIESTTNAGNVAGAIIYDREAYANAGTDKTRKEINERRLDKTIVGHTYHELDALVDPTRVKVVEFTPISITKKVND